MLRNLGGRPRGASRRPHLTRLLGVLARNGKKRSKARQKSFRNYISQFFAKVNIEVTRGHQRSKDPNVFSLITFELGKLEKKFGDHRVPLVETRPNICMLTFFDLRSSLLEVTS